MSRILLMSLAGRGHINPLAPMARKLTAAGHTLGWLARDFGHVPDRPEVPGVEVLPLDWSYLPPGRTLDFGGAARTFETYLAINIEWRLNCIPPLVPRLREAIRAFGAELLVIDGQVYPGVIAAHLEGLPYIGAITSPAFLMPPDFDCDLTRTLAAMSPLRSEIFAGYGMTPDFAAWDCLSPHRNLLFALPELVGPLPPCAAPVIMVGPSIAFERLDDPVDFPWARLRRDRPLVYASFGTVWYSQPDLFRTIARAADSLDLQLVMTIGGLAATPLVDDLPASTVAVRYSPQLDLLRQAAVCVTHGGANTVMEALYYGVPQLVVPICTDQPINAHFVARAGAGITVPPAELTVERCREALISLLRGDGPWRLAADRISRAYQAADGGQVAADLVRQMLARTGDLEMA